MYLSFNAAFSVNFHLQSDLKIKSKYLDKKFRPFYDTPIHFVTKNPNTKSIQTIDGYLEHPNYSMNHRYPDLIILKLRKALIMIHNSPGQKIPFMPFDNSAYYNQFFNQKIKDEVIEKQQYYPQDRGGKYKINMQKIMEQSC